VATVYLDSLVTLLLWPHDWTEIEQSALSL